MTGQLAAAAADGSHPLSPDQITQVAQIIVKNGAQGPDGGFAIPSGKLGNASEQLQAFLSPLQMADFQGLLQQQQFDQALSASLRTPSP